MPSASSTSSTRRRIASGENPRFSSTNARSRSTWSTTNCDSGSWATKPDDVGELPRVVRARRPAEHDDVAAEATRRSRAGTSPLIAPQQRALARARRADDEQQLARRDVEVDVVQRGDARRRGTRTTRRGTRSRSCRHRRGRASTGTSSGSSASGRQQVQRRPRERAGEPDAGCCRRSTETDAMAIGATSTAAAATSQSAARHAARAVARSVRVPDEASRMATAEPAGAGRARAPPPPCSTARRARRTRRRARAATRRRTTRRSGRVAGTSRARSRARPSTRRA